MKVTIIWYIVVLTCKRIFLKPGLKFSNLPIMGMKRQFSPTQSIFSANLLGSVEYFVLFYKTLRVSQGYKDDTALFVKKKILVKPLFGDLFRSLSFSRKLLIKIRNCKDFVALSKSIIGQDDLKLEFRHILMTINLNCKNSIQILITI